MGTPVDGSSRLETDLEIEVSPQPDDTSCGPTCLHAIYRYFGQGSSLSELITRVPVLETGGTLAVLLGVDALLQGYQATIYTYNLRIFDPTWFNLDSDALKRKLEARARAVSKRKLKTATLAYLRFLNLGGRILFEDLTDRLLYRHLDQRLPILTGLSSSWLYRMIREVPESNLDDDIRGEPSGHFVVLSGIEEETGRILVADPYAQNPISPNRRYAVDKDRLINAILLGVLTYDANLLILEPRHDAASPRC